MANQSSRWLQISVTAEREAVDDVVGYLNRYCAGGAVIEELASPDGRLESPQVLVKGFLPVDDTETHRKLEIALLLLSRASPISEPISRVLEPEDWAESWKAFFPPLQIGRRTVIVPTWQTYDARPDDIIIRIDPGMAFGTGLHATTRLCLEALERLIAPDLRVLDVGTGSGILAISAALQGAGSVVAIDTDPIAVQVTKENAALNDVGDRIEIRRGTLPGAAPPGIPTHQETGYDLLLVNILAEIIIGMASGIAGALRPGGRVITSGIIEPKADDVAAALEQQGIVIDERLAEDHWISLVGHRP